MMPVWTKAIFPADSGTAVRTSSLLPSPKSPRGAGPIRLSNTAGTPASRNFCSAHASERSPAADGVGRPPTVSQSSRRSSIMAFDARTFASSGATSPAGGAMRSASSSVSMLLARGFAIPEARGDVVAVHAGDEVGGDLLRADGLALAEHRATPKVLFHHLDHVQHALVALRLPLRE